MDLTPYLDSVAHDLDRATALADEDVRDVAHRLAAALQPGLRLALVRAISDTAAVISAELDDAVATVTMAGSEPVVNVTRTRPHGPPAAPPPPPPQGPEPDAGSARVTLRLPERLKSRAEELAAQAGQSLNTWLVQAVRRAAEHQTRPSRLGSGHLSGWA